MGGSAARAAEGSEFPADMAGERATLPLAGSTGVPTASPPTPGAAPVPPGLPALHVEFAGELIPVDPSREFTIGRDGDLVVDDNRYLHRRFLTIRADRAMWWLENSGTRLAATLTDSTGRVHASLAPGARLPIVFDRLHVLFSAGSTTYDLELISDGGYAVAPSRPAAEIGDATVGDVPLSPAQRLLVVALAENVLRRTETGRGEVPGSAEAAARLGWTLAAFTRRLDTVCAKLEREGVTGLRGGRGRLATNRRLRLVEHAVATRLVTREDLAMLDQLPPPSTPPGDVTDRP